MRRFTLVRYADISGVSGTGVVAEGVEFSSGMVALNWAGRLSSMAFYFSMSDLLRVHGHEGASDILWLD